MARVLSETEIAVSTISSHQPWDTGRTGVNLIVKLKSEETGCSTEKKDISDSASTPLTCSTGKSSNNIPSAGRLNRKKTI